MNGWLIDTRLTKISAIFDSRFDGVLFLTKIRVSREKIRKYGIGPREYGHEILSQQPQSRESIPDVERSANIVEKIRLQQIQTRHGKNIRGWREWICITAVMVCTLRLIIVPLERCYTIVFSEIALGEKFHYQHQSIHRSIDQLVDHSE